MFDWLRKQPDWSFEFVADVNYPDGAVVKPGQSITKAWLFKCIRPEGSSGKTAKRTSGDFGPEEFVLPGAKYDEEVIVSTKFIVPTTPGLHRATYHIYDQRSRTRKRALGFWVEVRVVQAKAS
ncbi:MAG: NBR1-Ig-like domain-containing protein [bacterium]|nr:NBR1-Ig-like domain-containing protein [bacterium]